MHDYEFDVITGKLTNMKSWKKSDTWIEQNPAWRASGDLTMYDIEIKGNDVYLQIRPKQ
jgi:nitrite reductase/ring-hydroxylating ferredoxin subunit